MISRSELQARLQDAGLEAYAATLADHARPAIHIDREVTDENQIAIGTSKLGGSPDVPAGFEWPHKNNRPFTFLAQFRLSEVAPFDMNYRLPEAGMLYFFYDMSHSTGGSVSYHPSEDATMLIRHPIDNALPTARLRFSTEWSFPSDEYLHNSVGIQIDGLHDGELDLYDLLHLPPQFPHHTLLGHPYEIQGDVRYEVLMDIHDMYSTREVKQWVEDKRGDEWLLLLQLDTDNGADGLGVMWGDAGMLYFMVTESALAQCDFSVSRVIIQSY